MSTTNETMDQSRRASILMKLSEFEIPPMQDALLIGRRAMIGVEAVRKMVNALAPEQYEIVPVSQGVFEAVVFRKSLMQMIPTEKLIPLVLREGEKIAKEETVIKVKMEITISVACEVEL